MSEDIGLYIHIPFCVRKCEYCDFLSFASSKEQREEYLIALQREIKERAVPKDNQVKTIFFGGGTPSILLGEQIKNLMETINQSYFVDPQAEITLEMNPGTVTKEKLTTYREAGINRLSIGLQSTDPKELKLLGRIHTYEEFLESFYLARACGFDNINVDLMSALPNQSVTSWRETLQKVIQLKPEHISAYGLIIEEGTPFYERYEEDERIREEGEQPQVLPSEEEERQFYYDTKEILKDNGYHRYEISNYAKVGYECKHNSSYWKRTPYLGFGLGASSLWNHQRLKQTSDWEKYILRYKYLEERSSNTETIDVEPLSKREEMEEFFFLGLRRMEGVTEEGFERNFGILVEEVYGEYLKKLQKEGLLLWDKGKISLTERGIDVSNYVFAGFLE